MGFIRKAFAGALAGMIGTAAMDAVWYARYRRSGGSADPMEWEFGGVSSWSDVSAPGMVGEQVLTAATGSQPPDAWAAPTQNAVHWLTGIGYGKLFGLTIGRFGLIGGLVMGVAAWFLSYVVLPPMGIYKPMAEYDTKTLGRDLSAHLVFGGVTGIAFSILGGNKRKRCCKGKRCTKKGAAA